MNQDDDVVLKAARTLERMQKEAEKRVLAAFRFNDNTVRGCVVEMAGRTMCGHTIVIRFDLNGQEFERRLEMDDAVQRNALLSKEKAFGYLVDAVGREVVHVFTEMATPSLVETLTRKP